MVMVGVDDEAVQHRRDAFRDLLGERVQLAGLDEGGDIVVRAKRLPGRLQAGADAFGSLDMGRSLERGSTDSNR